MMATISKPIGTIPMILDPYLITKSGLCVLPVMVICGSVPEEVDCVGIAENLILLRFFHVKRAIRKALVITLSELYSRIVNNDYGLELVRG